MARIGSFFHAGYIKKLKGPFLRGPEHYNTQCCTCKAFSVGFISDYLELECL